MPTENKPIEPRLDLNTSDAGRSYIAKLFETVLRRHDYRQYISERLAGDFACTLSQHFEEIKAREAALQLLLNERDEQVHSLEQRRQAEQQACMAAERRVAEMETALKFYAEREHYHFESGNWDTVSGEPLNILWCGDEPDFIEDGSVARAALLASAEPSKDDDWHMNPCKQGHRDVGAAGGVAHCYTCDEKIEAATTQEAFERWNATHPQQ